MRDDWFESLMTAFDKIVREHDALVQALGIQRRSGGIHQPAKFNVLSAS